MADRAAWEHVVKGVRNILSFVAECVTAHSKRAEAEGRPSLTPYAFFCTHCNISGYSEIAGSARNKHWKGRFEQQQPTTSAEMSPAEITNSSIHTMVYHASAKVAGAKNCLVELNRAVSEYRAAQRALTSIPPTRNKQQNLRTKTRP